MFKKKLKSLANQGNKKRRKKVGVLDQNRLYSEPYKFGLNFFRVRPNEE